MKRFGFDLPLEDGSSAVVAKIPTLKQSLLTGGVGFCLASLLVFATVAFAETWMYQHLGLTGAYLIWTILFILLGGAVYLPLLIRRGRWLRFYLLFGTAFLFYAIGWVSAYFVLRGRPGEWLGSLTGSILMALVFAFGFGALRTSAKLIAVLFVANSLGYFLGEGLNSRIGGKIGMLLWGAAYGLFLGAGIGAAVYFAQAAMRERLHQRADKSVYEQE
jgi:hypothetical protein